MMVCLYYHHNSPYCGSRLCSRNVLSMSVPSSTLYRVLTAGGDFLGLCDEKSSYKHVSDFGRLRSYGRYLIPIHALV